MRAEAAADHVHARQQSLIENLRRARADIDRLLGKVGDLLVLPPLEALADLMQDFHVTPRLAPGRLTSHHSTTSPLSHETPRFLSGKPRSGDRQLAWGVSPRKTVPKKQTSREAATDNLKIKASAHETPKSVAPSGLAVMMLWIPGAHAPGY
jgi:hypothetical protein